MPRALMFFEWVVYFKDGSYLTQHKEDGTEVPWSEVQTYHENTSKAKRAAWVHFTPRRAKNANIKYGGEMCVSKNLPAHFVEAVNGELPFLRRRLAYSWRGNSTGQIYYYIMGSGGRKVLDSDGAVQYVGGYYSAIDMHGHTRMCGNSNVVVPVIPPEKADVIENAEENETSGA